ncbi:MAG TPA: phosphatase PAP2 family protein [Bryobacteraceae bacterium]|nr:phosphatase PAP2 family protein [Bryobacteraceae bacterium]
MIRIINAGDIRLMRRVNRWHAPMWVRMAVVFASRAGDGWLWGTIGLVILLFGGADRFAAIESAGAAVLAGFVAFLVLKRITGRERPLTVEAHAWASLLPPDRFSFPSGHTITAFAVAVPIGWFYPSLLIGLIFCALSVGASRILLGLHYLSDVIAGIAIGAGIGFAAVIIRA